MKICFISVQTFLANSRYSSKNCINVEKKHLKGVSLHNSAVSTFDLKKKKKMFLHYYYCYFCLVSPRILQWLCCICLIYRLCFHNYNDKRRNQPLMQQ